MNPHNPFSFSAATDLTAEDILCYYIPEHNYSRFIQSKRNVFLLGERGTGKTMTLLYHSLEVQQLKAKKVGKDSDYRWIGVYVPCNTPLIHRAEHELLSKHRAFSLSEHYLVLAIVGALVKTLELYVGNIEHVQDKELAIEIEEILATELPPGETFLSRMRTFTLAEVRRTQVAINQADENFYSNAFSFATLILPLIEVLGSIPRLSNTHFHLLIDDADYLNVHQIAALNSWIAYREHSKFSFKVATSKVMRPSRVTASGGSIEEGHDFTVIDMENPLHNEQSDFGRLAKLIVERRLAQLGTNVTAEEFFPLSSRVRQQMEECKEEAKNLARRKYPNGSKKQISDYVYKYHRALYFRRPSKANRPAYSGFDMITYLSTGIVRNLLEPCFMMYDMAVSRRGQDTGLQVRSIDPVIQNAVILKLSERPWLKMKEGLHYQIPNCTNEKSDQIAQLFEALAQLFKRRLMSDCSEPRATSFTISGGNSPERCEVEDLLQIARKALLVYVRLGTAKDYGSRERYFVPTRMLWPSRGLDPLGQHARISLKARDLLAASKGDGNPWTDVVESSIDDSLQGSLFDE